MDKDKIKQLIENKDKIIKLKKAQIKHADGILINDLSVLKTVKKKELTTKAGSEDQVEVTAVINTTYLFDSHEDVHIDGLWNKSLAENRGIMHLQEHEMKFDKIISDGEDLKAYTVNVTWKELGFNYSGKTEALTFDSIVKKSRNEYMMNQYKARLVRNHSVGMQYIKLYLAVNDEDYKEEFAVWNKYYDKIANKADVDEAGYFWAVTEAKLIEGSAVPAGSNWATPTREVKTFEAVHKDTSNPYDKLFDLEADPFTSENDKQLNELLTLLKFEQ